MKDVIVLKGEAIAQLVSLMGYVVEWEEEDLKMEISVCQGDICDADDPTQVIYFDGLVAWLTDYPEDGSIGLEPEKYLWDVE